MIQLYWIHKRTKGNFKEIKANICITSLVIHNKIDSELGVSGSRVWWVVLVMLIDCKIVRTVVFIFHTHRSLATYTKGKCQVNCREHLTLSWTVLSLLPIGRWSVKSLNHLWIIQIPMDMQNGRNIMNQNKESIIFVCFCRRKHMWQQQAKWSVWKD